MSTNSIVKLAEKLQDDQWLGRSQSLMILKVLLPPWLKKLEALRDEMNEQCGDTFNNDCPCPVCISRRKLTALLHESLEKL